MLILHLLHLIFPSTVSRATWGFSSWSKLLLEELFHQDVVTGTHKTERCQWKGFWVGFQLWQLIGKAALHPSIPAPQGQRAAAPAIFLLCSCFIVVNAQGPGVCPELKNNRLQAAISHTWLQEQGQSSTSKIASNYAQHHTNIEEIITWLV